MNGNVGASTAFWSWRQIKWVWKSIFSPLLTHHCTLEHCLKSSLPNLFTIYWPHRKEKSVGDLFWKSRLKLGAALSGQVIPPLTGATCLHEHLGGIRGMKAFMHSSRNFNSLSIYIYSSIGQILENRKTYIVGSEFESFVFWAPSTPQQSEENNIYAKGRSGGARIELCRWKKLIALPLPEARPR